jgi:thiol-disulfide isomerase/thioredoxin
MAILTAAVVVLGILCVLDLLLSFGIIRRLREQNETLRSVQNQAAAVAEPDIALPAGSEVCRFSTTTVTGTPLSNADTADSRLLVGFFSPGCVPCKERIPEFIEYAARFEGRVIAVAAGSAEETADMVAQLGEVAEVVLEQTGGPLHKAFEATGYPALCLVDGTGIVLASGWEMSVLPAPALL